MTDANGYAGSISMGVDAMVIPEKDLRVPLILTLYELGGRLSACEATELVGYRVAHLLNGDDRELRTHDGKAQWENRVHWSRLQLIGKGLLKPTKESGRGVWELTKKGNMLAAHLVELLL